MYKYIHPQSPGHSAFVTETPNDEAVPNRLFALPGWVRAFGDFFRRTPHGFQATASRPVIRRTIHTAAVHSPFTCKTTAGVKPLHLKKPQIIRKHDREPGINRYFYFRVRVVPGNANPFAL